MSAGRRRTARVLLLALGFPLVAAGVALCLGPSATGPAEVWDALAGRGEGWTWTVVRVIRLPRVVLGLLVGASLALSGVLLQGLFRNDLAEPYLVGVGPGAFLGVTVAALVAGGAALPDPATRGLFALLGAAGVSLLVFALGRRGGRLAGANLLLGGVAVGAFVSALATVALYVAVPDWHQVVYWLLGHLTPREGSDLLLVAAALLVATLLAVRWARDLDAVALGEEGAWLVGVEVRRLLLLLGLAACLLAAAAVAVSGLIGFVGLLVPHLARRLVGPPHRTLVPAALGLGAGLLVLADAIARILQPPLEIPVGVVTAALGAPFLALLVLRPRAG